MMKMCTMSSLAALCPGADKPMTVRELALHEGVTPGAIRQRRLRCEREHGIEFPRERCGRRRKGSIPNWP